MRHARPPTLTDFLWFYLILVALLVIGAKLYLNGMPS